MSDNLQFDQFVKEQLSKYKAEVPDRIWDNITAARRASKPKVFWYSVNSGKLLIAAAIILSCSIGGYLLFHTNSAHKTGISKEIATGSASNNVSTPAINKATNSASSGTNSNSNPSTSANINGNAKPQSPVAFINPNSLLVKDASTIGHKFYSLKSAPFESEDKMVTPAKTQTVTTNNDKVDPDAVSAMSFPFSLQNARDLMATNKIVAGKPFIGCPTPERNAAGNKKYWEVYAGPDYVFNNYKTFGDTASYNYLQKRKASTTFTSAYSAGVRYTRVFDNGMSARMGVNYSQTNEKFNYVNPNELRFITVITKRVVVRAPGDTLYFSDTLQYQQTGTHVKTTYNHYRNVDIPLVIGYELGNGKIHANINAGVIINVYSWYKGDILDTAYQPVSITTGKGSSNYQYRTNIGVGFLGSVSLYYKLNDRMHLLLEPYFRYNLSPISKESLNLQQKYHTVGLRTGIRIDLP